MMEFSGREQDGLAILDVSGRLDTSTAEAFKAGCQPYLRKGARVVLDLSALDYLSSAGLRSILSLLNQLKALDGGLALAGLKGIVKEVFTLTKCDAIMPVFDTVEEVVRGKWHAGTD